MALINKTTKQSTINIEFPSFWKRDRSSDIQMDPRELKRLINRNALLLDQSRMAHQIYVR
ncbi:MAG: hypothetical protein INQ03_11595 [Candidatus Heimdallarchaeota archaeon]|nr:hypothetical protein [Candidatus Heimdallarchaeota archaeon]